MRVLWITNTIFPAPSKVLDLAAPVVGGWMYGLADQLVAGKEIKLAVAATYQGMDLKVLDLEGIRYYLLPSRCAAGYQQHLEPLWQTITEEYQPDVIHIHGTEYLHGLACMRACQSHRYVISIQGLVGVIASYYYAGLTTREIFKSITFRDLVRWDTIFHRKKNMARFASFEEEYLTRTKNVIGRTTWDYARTKAINPALAYHYCNETLRDVFYSADKWDSQKKTDHVIFLSQAAYPVKGLHLVLKAVALLAVDFPNLKVRVAGHSLTNASTLLDRMKRYGYGSYISSLITDLALEDRVEFTGPLSGESMVAEYLSAHLFVCPSSIENSPNSIAEAQILGVPTIASYVGGVPDMICHGETGLLYRFEEVHMLAENIRRVFTDNQLAQHLSVQGIVAAEKRHDRRVNRDEMIAIYGRVK